MVGLMPGPSLGLHPVDHPVDEVFLPITWCLELSQDEGDWARARPVGRAQGRRRAESLAFEPKLSQEFDCGHMHTERTGSFRVLRELGCYEALELSVQPPSLSPAP